MISAVQNELFFVTDNPDSTYTLMLQMSFELQVFGMRSKSLFKIGLGSCGVVDQKCVFFSDADPDPTFQNILDSDPVWDPA
jgi:hypothetical protein